MKVLIAEDERMSRTILEQTLTGWGYEVISVANGDAALAALQEKDAATLAILDWEMPGLAGVEVCRVVRQRPGERYTYMLLLTGKKLKEDIIEGLLAGADDFLSKPYDPLELKARLIAGRRVLDLQEQLIAGREALRLQATRDFLTGIWNRSAILEILDREVHRARREAKPVGVVLADLDHFKRINDTYGHLGGDAALRETAQRMVTAMRAYDLVGRFGGEEFLIVLPGCDMENTRKFCERVRERIAAEPIRHLEQAISVSISLGAVVYASPQGGDVNSLLNAADSALYRAKDSGRNRVEVAALVSP